MSRRHVRWMRAGSTLVVALDVVVASGTAPAASAQATTAFSGTASLKTSNTVLFADKSYGPSRGGAQAQVDQCNGFRANYRVPAVSPPETVLAGLDVTLEEKYIDGDRALTVETGHTLILPDVQRWLSELRASPSGTPPGTPPNCARYELVETRHGTLWRDGLMYELRYRDHKAMTRWHSVPGPTLRMVQDFANARRSHELGESCRDVVGAADLPGEGHACIWDVFPYVSRLNWPFALSGRVQFGPTASTFKTIVPIAVERGHPIPPSVFDIPAGFTVVGQ